ncbi:MAG: hypothetical protein J5506_00805 [Prevotella sp.]|nr:hypothetical protein [Prevotella sp.]
MLFFAVIAVLMAVTLPTTAAAQQKQSQKQPTATTQQAVPDFEAMLRLIQAVTLDWKGVTGELMEATGLKLVLEEHEKDPEEEMVTDWIVYGKDIKLEPAPDGGKDPEPTGAHACELRIVGDTSQNIWITFWNEADYKQFLDKVHAYGLLRVKDSGESSCYVPTKRLGRIIDVTSDELMERAPLATFSDQSDNVEDGKFMFSLSPDY